MATKSWFTVPEGIRIVFDKFPLHVNPPAALPASVVSSCNEQDPPTTAGSRRLILHVYNIDPTDKLATDPESLEIQALLKLKKLDQNVYVKVVSSHSAPQTPGPTRAASKLPYLIDVAKNNKRSIYSSVSSVRNNLLLPLQGLPVMHRALITSALRDAWLVTVLLNDDLRQLVFGEGPYRIQIVPAIVEQFLQHSWTSQVVEELRPRYPAIIDSFVSNSRIGGGLYHLVKNQWSKSSSPIVEFLRGTKQGQAITEEIYARAEECLTVFNAMLLEGDYLGIGNEDETNEDVTESGLGPLDILLYSYVYAIENRKPSDTELATMLAKFPLIVEHSRRVHAELYP